MKLTALLLTITFLQLSAEGFSQKITLKGNNIPLEKVFSTIEKQSGYFFFYKYNEIETADPVTLSLKDASLEEALDKTFKGQPYEFAIEDKTIVVNKVAKNTTTQKVAAIDVKGNVVDNQGQPLPGATIRVKGTNLGTITDGNGNFSIKAIATDAVLVISYTGFLQQEVPVGDKTQFEIVLQDDLGQLSDVVIVAYGSQKRESITGAVSTITSKDIEKRPISSVTAVLEGAAPGIQVNNSYGEPGSDGAVRIRGFTSLSENGPTVVLDGVIYNGNISDINPNDVDNISVLKDATSAALYGNRGSNGVILITTKRGKNNQSTLNFNATQGFYTRGIADYDRMGANDFMESMWQGYRNSLKTGSTTLEAANVKANEGIISNILRYNIYNLPNKELFDENGKLAPGAAIRSGYNDLDWNKGIERVGHRQEYGLSSGGGTDKGSFYFSSGYLNEKGYVKRSEFERFTGRLNADVTPKDWIKSGLSISGSHQMSSKNSGSPVDNPTSFANPFFFARNIAPIYPIYLHDMATGEYILDEHGNKQYDGGGLYSRPQYLDRHSIWENKLDKDNYFRNTLAGQIFTNIYFLNDFTFSFRGDLNVRNQEEQTYNNALIGDGAGNDGRASRTIYRYKNYTFIEQLDWAKQLNDENHLDVMVAHENYSYNYNYLYGYKTTETFTGKPELVNFTNITNLTDYQHNYRSESFLGRARYNFKDRYYLDASIRRDGSSRFNPETRWGNFWSIGGSWLISKEDFMTPYSDKISSLKLRSSYGQVGNDASADYYAHMALYSIAQNANVAALYKIQNAAENLKWESSNAFGIAIEGRLYNKMNFSLEYFDKRSQDLLFDIQLPLSAGATSTGTAESTIKKNAGIVSNRGIELSLDYDILRNSDFRWNVGTNLTVMKNKIIELPEQNRENGLIDGTKKRVEGRGIYDFWLYQYVGVDQMTGTALYEIDTEKFDVTVPTEGLPGYINPNNVIKVGENNYTDLATTYGLRGWSGNAIPKYYGSFNTALSYKDFSLSALVSYSKGGKMLDYTYQGLMSISANPSALHKDLLGAWSEIPAGMTENSPNRIDPNGIPRMDFTSNTRSNATSTQYLKDASYLVIKNISLSYRMPESITNRLNVGGLTFNATIENLATFTKLQGMNPQQSFNGINNNGYVTPRVFSFGLNLSL